VTLEEEFSLLLDCGVTLEEDFALLLDFALELDCGVTLEEDFAELLDATLEEDFALLLDFALELDCGVTLEEEDFVLLLDFALLLDTLVSLTLDFGVTLEEEDLAELLDTLVSSSLDCGVTSSILLDDSSSRGAKLLSSSQAAKRKILAIKNTIPMCPTHFNDDKSPNFFICPPSKSYTTNITKTPRHIVKNACKQTFSAHFVGQIRFIGRGSAIPQFLHKRSINE
jgi:hypothetical protein